MRSTYLILLLLGTGCLLPAQSYRTSPAGYKTTYATSTATSFGGDSFGRVMFLDGDQRGKPMQIKAVAYRLAAKGLWIGRTWSNVDLDLADCDYDKPSTTFSHNPTSTPTRVFQGSTTWPSATVAPSSKTWSLRFPFARPWVYAGTHDLCLDYDFTAGTLQGGTAAWWKFSNHSYRLDGFVVPTWSPMATATSVGTPLACKDTLRNNSATFDFTLMAWAHPKSPETFELLSDAVTAKGARVIDAIGLAGSKTGIQFPGVSCQRLHVDFGKPFLLTPHVVGASGRSWTPVPKLPYSDALAGTELWGQAAWADTSTGRLLLTAASLVALPRLEPRYRIKALVEPDNVKKSSGGTFLTQYGYAVVTRYRGPSLSSAVGLGAVLILWAGCSESEAAEAVSGVDPAPFLAALGEEHVVERFVARQIGANMTVLLVAATSSHHRLALFL